MPNLLIINIYAFMAVEHIIFLKIFLNNKKKMLTNSSNDYIVAVTTKQILSNISEVDRYGRSILNRKIS